MDTQLQITADNAQMIEHVTHRQGRAVTVEFELFVLQHGLSCALVGYIFVTPSL
jgi:hypothetical protein